MRRLCEFDIERERSSEAFIGGSLTDVCTATRWTDAETAICHTNKIGDRIEQIARVDIPVACHMISSDFVPVKSVCYDAAGSNPIFDTPRLSPAAFPSTPQATGKRPTVSCDSKFGAIRLQGRPQLHSLVPVWGVRSRGSTPLSPPHPSLLCFHYRAMVSQYLLAHQLQSALPSGILWTDVGTFDRRSYPVAASMASTVVTHVCHRESMLLVFDVSMAMTRVLVVTRLKSLSPLGGTTA